MRNIAILLCFVLAECTVADEAKLAQEREDVAKCASYGAYPGEPAYFQCRAQLEDARTVATASGKRPKGNPPVSQAQRAAQGAADLD
jgi:hypothetical protein